MSQLKKIVTYAISLPKTIWFNFKAFDFVTALRLPVAVHYRTKIVSIKKNQIILPQQVSPLMIKLGFGGTITIESNRRNIIALDSGCVIFNGKAHLAEGFVIRTSGGGGITFGNNFSANKNFRVISAESITFGEDVLIGWNVVFRDIDGHTIYKNNQPKRNRREITIGNHTWICSECHFLKGAKVGDSSVVGYRSLVSGAMSGNNVLVVGTPAHVIQNDINWKY